MIAVKRLNEHAAVYDFTNEFLLARLEHINLVRLLGWCIHGKERILVYELMHKGGLHQFIFGMFSYNQSYSSKHTSLDSFHYL